MNRILLFYQFYNIITIFIIKFKWYVWLHTLNIHGWTDLKNTKSE